MVCPQTEQLQCAWCVLLKNSLVDSLKVAHIVSFSLAFMGMCTFASSWHVFSMAPKQSLENKNSLYTQGLPCPEPLRWGCF